MPPKKQATSDNGGSADGASAADTSLLGTLGINDRELRIMAAAWLCTDKPFEVCALNGHRYVWKSPSLMSFSATRENCNASLDSTP